MNSVVRQLLEQDTDVVMVDTGDSYEGSVPDRIWNAVYNDHNVRPVRDGVIGTSARRYADIGSICRPHHCGHDIYCSGTVPGFGADMGLAACEISEYKESFRYQAAYGIGARISVLAGRTGALSAVLPRACGGRGQDLQEVSGFGEMMRGACFTR